MLRFAVPINETFANFLTSTYSFLKCIIYYSTILLYCRQLQITIGVVDGIFFDSLPTQIKNEKKFKFLMRVILKIRNSQFIRVV